jgi:hypothetical protein
VSRLPQVIKPCGTLRGARADWRLGAGQPAAIRRWASFAPHQPRFRIHTCDLRAHFGCRGAVIAARFGTAQLLLGPRRVASQLHCAWNMRIVVAPSTLLLLLCHCGAAAAQERSGDRYQKSPFAIEAQLAARGAAAAQERAGDRYRKSPFAIEAQLAPFGGPLGMAGVALDVALVPQLSLVAGIGASAFSPQWGVAVRPRLPLIPLVALSLSAGYSRGDYRDFRIMGGSFFYGDCSWINVDFGPELRFRSHWLLRPFVGVSQLVHSNVPVWYEGGSLDTEWDYGSPESRWPMLFYVGLSIGGYFGF